MYKIHSITQDILDPEQAKNIKQFIPLLKSVIGYTDEEINIMIKNKFVVNAIATNLTKEQVVLAFQPFLDIDSPMYISEYDDITGELVECAIDETRLGMIKQSPKSHYYDEPVISREHLVAPDYVPSKPTIDLTPQPTTPTITCPYCKSTDCKKISGLSKAGSVALWGIFALGKTTKQWHCNKCGSDF